MWLHAFEAETETVEDVARSAREEVDGFIIVSGGDMTDERITRLEQTGLPTVLVDNFVIGHNVHAVVADDFGAGYVATRHLLDLGHRRIAMIAGSRAYRKFVHRQNGYVDALAEAGVTPEACWRSAPRRCSARGRLVSHGLARSKWLNCWHCRLT